MEEDSKVGRAAAGWLIWAEIKDTRVGLKALQGTETADFGLVEEGGIWKKMQVAAMSDLEDDGDVIIGCKW